MPTPHYIDFHILGSREAVRRAWPAMVPPLAAIDDGYDTDALEAMAPTPAASRRPWPLGQAHACCSLSFEYGYDSPLDSPPTPPDPVPDRARLG